MKTRNGLVSNSSSSSFIIHYINMWDNSKFKCVDLTKKEVSILKKNGYKLCDCEHPSQIEYNTDGIQWFTNKKHIPRKCYSISYAKSILCNQNDEIYFLVKNNIPFVASVHYGHETYIYPKDSKFIFVFYNHGLNAETYHQKDTEDKLSKLVENLEKYPSSEKILVSEFIKLEEQHQADYKESLNHEN